MVHKPRALLPNSFVRFVLHQPQYNTDYDEQQPMVKHHLKPSFDLLQQLHQFITKGQPKSYPAIDNTHTTSRAPANQGH
jgi:hypothetical protein